tara:strand:- start:234 stop:869 length:636 start_codon:yes stop_codon:yes gene_type:complete
MNKQNYFDYYLKEIKDASNFYVNETNYSSYQVIVNNNNNIFNIYLYAPKKSGKTHLIDIWSERNNAILYNGNIDNIFKLKKNIAIDNLFNNLNEENVFHIINHCNSLNLKLFFTSDKKIEDYEFKLPDLKSRLLTFYKVEIKNPDDDMIKIILTKLLHEKQFIIKNKEIFDFLIKRIERSYESIYNLVERLDKISLEKKRQLTIPLIKEII